MFHSLSKDVVYDILDKIISEIEYRLRDQKIKITLTKDAKDYIIDQSYDENYGARPIKRYVSRHLETLIANKLIQDEIKFNSEIIVDIKDGKLYIK